MITDADKKKNEENGHALVEQANQLIILTPGHYQKAVKGVDTAKAFQTAVKDVWDPVCDAANKAHKAATTGRKDQIEPFIKAEKIFKRLLNDHDLEQERLAAAEQKLRDDERAKRDKELLDEQNRKLKLAADLEKSGKVEEAQDQLEDAADIQDEIESIPEPYVEKATPSGMTYIDNWKAFIVDPKLVPREFCIPDQKKLDQYAKMMKGESAPAGVTFKNDRTSRRV